MRRIALCAAVMTLLLAPAADALTIGISAATPATFGTALAPGTTTASTLGTVTVTSVGGLTGWTLSVKDATGNAGRMAAATGATCTNSAATLANPLQLRVTDPGNHDSISSAAQHAVTATNSTFATYNSALTLLSAISLDTKLSQTVGSGEVLKAGCLYSTTLTYTVQ